MPEAGRAHIARNWPKLRADRRQTVVRCQKHLRNSSDVLPLQQRWKRSKQAREFDRARKEQPLPKLKTAFCRGAELPGGDILSPTEDDHSATCMCPLWGWSRAQCQGRTLGSLYYVYSSKLAESHQQLQADCIAIAHCAKTCSKTVFRLRHSGSGRVSTTRLKRWLARLVQPGGGVTTRS